MKKYYDLTTGETAADLYIYGDIVSTAWLEGESAAFDIANDLAALPESIKRINCYINSYGGEVAAGLAIHNLLARHKARITTCCDGFACSAASIVFMAGDDRIMNESSLLMIHNAWTIALGNADELRKEADDLEKISETAANAYRAKVNLSDEDLEALLDAQTWISPADALKWGFATSIAAIAVSARASMNARRAVFEAVKSNPAPKRAELPPEEPEQKARKFFNFRKDEKK